MQEYLGRQCKITVNVVGKNLFFTGIIQNVTKSHITFMDKYGIQYTFNIANIIEINAKQ